MTDPAEPNLDSFYDSSSTGGRLICRICGCVVPSTDDYPRVHWDWHEAANGA